MERSPDVVEMVMRAAESDPRLGEDARLLLLSVLTGNAELQDEFTGGAPAPAPVADPDAVPPPTGAYLKSISVAGFRGIGPEGRLTLHPAPGLVVVAGRNGSGKSTFSEALEVALTRTSYRWREKAVQWQAGWRNLHVPDPCRIRVELAEEGVGVTTAGVDWGGGADLGDGSFWIQRPGERRNTSPDPLGWARPLELFRPLLSYDELGGILEARPSELYDKLSTVLGLTTITTAQERLDGIVKDAGAPRREAKRQLADVLGELGQSDDPRAIETYQELGGRHPDLDLLERLATGVSAPPSGELATLRALAVLTVPPVDEVRAAAAERAEALAALADTVGAATDAVVRRIAVLTHALKHVDAEGPGKCPVCGVGELDEAWAEQAGREIAELNEQTATLRAAGKRREAAEQRLRSLLPVLPAVLEARLDVDLPGRAEVARAWRAAAGMDVRDNAGAAAFVTAYDQLDGQLAELRRTAATELQHREDRWAPLARNLAELVGALRRADESDRRLAIAKAAADWLKDHANELRNARLRPVAAAAREIWALLRQESNVDLGAIELEGAKTRRRVTVSATVDGHEAGALTVMSQGELHALALALFLPRATLPASPFRFVVVDDPVQAMDPAKVDGLARVLDRIGRTRQVIVFTHDDRLPESVRRLGLNARILEVHRAEGSRVEVVSSSDPTARYFDEAHAVARDRGADQVVWRRVIPVLCRMALENACRDLVMARRYGRGESRADVEAAWAVAQTSRDRIALAIRDDAEGDIRSWLEAGRRRRSAMWVVGSSSHAGLDRDPIDAIRDVEALVNDIRATVR
jgi:ABC-type lipoprotein export system ATPase subunit/energy-coupling factor transporter ATP-binding protein EcfA2